MNTSSTQQQSIPWIEKYRPSHFGDIVLSDENRQIFTNAISRKCVPNMCFYGPHGTGKTTTAVCFVQDLYRYCGLSHVPKSNIIHLNASDDRGIDIIRNQILQFVVAKQLFVIGTKFVILDEVDCMTEPAQQALKYLIQSNFNKNIRFILICNYISKINCTLLQEFMLVRFNQLPSHYICSFVQEITKKEKLQITFDELLCLQGIFMSDIRSFINFLQLNQGFILSKHIITLPIWEEYTNTIFQIWKDKGKDKDKEAWEKIRKIFIAYHTQYNVNSKTFFFQWMNYLIRYRNDIWRHSDADFTQKAEQMIHTAFATAEQLLMYFITNLYRENTGSV